MILKLTCQLASFPGPAQLSVACMQFFARARGEPGNEATCQLQYGQSGLWHVNLH